MDKLSRRLIGIFLCVFAGIFLGMDMSTTVPNFSHFIIVIIVSLFILVGGYLLVMFSD